MKKIKYFGLLLVFMLIMTGCGTSKNVSLEDAIKNTTNSKDMKMTVLGNLSANVEGKTFNATLTGNGETANGDSHIKLDIDLKDGDESDKSLYELYMVEKDGKYQIYTSEKENEWYLSTENKSSNEINADIILNNLKDSKEVTSDKSGHTKYEAKIDLVKLLSGQLGEETEEFIPSGITLEQTVNVYVKGKYVSEINIDASDLLNNAIPLVLEMFEEDEYKNTKFDFKCNLKIEMKDYGKVKNVKVPENVVKNAKED